MKTYNDYRISHLTFCSGNLMQAYKYKAGYIGKIHFSHRMYFRYASEAKANCIINGKFANSFEPSLNDNYYQANFEEGVVLSRDMENFVFNSRELHYTNYEKISVEKIQKLHVDIIAI